MTRHEQASTGALPSKAAAYPLAGAYIAHFATRANEQADTSAECVPFIFSSSLFDNVQLLLMHADRA